MDASRASTTSLARQLNDTCRLKGQFVLLSGKTSPEYLDKHLFEADPGLLREVAARMTDLLPPCDVLGGMELGGVPIATVMSQITGLAMVVIRKGGLTRAGPVVGGPRVMGRRVVVVEEAVTRATTICEAVPALRALGAIVEHAVCVIDRQQGASEVLAPVDVVLHSLFTAADLATARPA